MCMNLHNLSGLNYLIYFISCLFCSNVSIVPNRNRNYISPIHLPLLGTRKWIHRVFSFHKIRTPDGGWIVFCVPYSNCGCIIVPSLTSTTMPPHSHIPVVSAAHTIRTQFPFWSRNRNFDSSILSRNVCPWYRGGHIVRSSHNIITRSRKNDSYYGLQLWKLGDLISGCLL